MARYQRHIFICTNERPAGHPKGCCLEKGSQKVRDLMKAEIHKRSLKSVVRVNIAGCLDACEFGVSMVVYPEGVWYGGVTVNDVPEIIEEHIIKGKIVERLLIRDPRYAPASRALPPLQFSQE